MHAAADSHTTSLRFTSWTPWVFWSLVLSLFTRALHLTYISKSGTRGRPPWTEQLSSRSLSPGSFFVFNPDPFSLLSFLLYFVSPTNWLPPYILSVANHFPILQPLTLTLTLPCLCHWDESERYHILSSLRPQPNLTMLQGRILPVSSVFRLLEYTLLFLPDSYTFRFSADQWPDGVGVGG